MSIGRNRIEIIGNVGRDPEIRSTGDGKRVANLTVATSENWTDKATGEKKSQTEWHRVTIWGPLVDIVEKYVKKGSRVSIVGKIQTRKWMDKDGGEQHSTEIVVQGYGGEVLLLDARDDSEPRPGASAPYPLAPVKKPSGLRDEMDDELPF